jgi:hypothetical protein
MGLRRQDIVNGLRSHSHSPAFAAIPSHFRNVLADALLQRFGIWGIQATLKLLNELSDMQAID